MSINELRSIKEELMEQAKSNKPKANHPWKNSASIIRKEVSDWARDNSTNYQVNNFKKGGGVPQK
jgi:hypothetical protein